MFRQKLLIMQKLLNTKAHLGYQTAFSNYQPYLYGFRNETSIIDLDNTLVCLRRACNVIEFIIRKNGHLLFVNTTPEFNNIIRQTAKQTKHSFINYKWVGGLLTNWNHMQNVQRHFRLFGNLQKVDRQVYDNSTTAQLADTSLHLQKHTYKQPRSEGPENNKQQSLSFNAWRNTSTCPPYAFAGHKKPKSLMRSEGEGKAEEEQKRSAVCSPLATPFSAYRSITRTSVFNLPRYKKMQKCFEGILAKALPDCIIILNANRNGNAINEAKQLQIPIISVVDSTVSNKLHNTLTYPIPANADSVQFVYLLCNSILKTVLYSHKYKKALPVGRFAPHYEKLPGLRFSSASFLKR